DLIQRLSQKNDLPAVILTDLRMPEMSGVELLLKVRTLGVRAPVVVITGEGSIPDAVLAIKQGAFDFLAKPFIPLETLTRTVERAALFGAVTEERDCLRAALGQSA